MLGLSPIELIVAAIIVILIAFKGKDIGGQIGGAFREFKEATKEGKDVKNDAEEKVEELEKEIETLKND